MNIQITRQLIERNRIEAKNKKRNKQEIQSITSFSFDKTKCFFNMLILFSKQNIFCTYRQNKLDTNKHYHTDCNIEIT